MNEQFKKLTEALQNSDHHRESLYEVFEIIVKIFQEFSSDSKKIPPEKKEALQETLYTLITLIQPSIDRVSIAEEKLVRALDDPRFFDGDEWKAAQKSKEEILKIQVGID
jgi:hypothetical protein